MRRAVQRPSPRAQRSPPAGRRGLLSPRSPPFTSTLHISRPKWPAFGRSMPRGGLSALRGPQRPGQASSFSLPGPFGLQTSAVSYSTSTAPSSSTDAASGRGKPPPLPRRTPPRPTVAAHSPVQPSQPSQSPPESSYTTTNSLRRPREADSEDSPVRRARSDGEAWGPSVPRASAPSPRNSLRRPSPRLNSTWEDLGSEERPWRGSSGVPPSRPGGPAEPRDSSPSPSLSSSSRPNFLRPPRSFSNRDDRGDFPERSDEATRVPTMHRHTRVPTMHRHTDEATRVPTMHRHTDEATRVPTMHRHTDDPPAPRSARAEPSGRSVRDEAFPSVPPPPAPVGNLRWTQADAERREADLDRREAAEAHQLLAKDAPRSKSKPSASSRPLGASRGSRPSFSVQFRPPPPDPTARASTAPPPPPKASSPPRGADGPNTGAVAGAADDWEVSKCQGCGVGLQSAHPTHQGFIPAHIWDEFKRHRALLPSLAIPSPLGLPSARPTVATAPAEPSLTPDTSILDLELGEVEVGEEKGPLEAREVPPTSGDLAPLSLRSSEPSTSTSPLNETPARTRLICQRCHHLTHVGRVLPSAMGPDDFAQLLKSVRDVESLFVSVVDVFDWTGSVISDLRKFAGTNPIILVANKLDLLPEGVHTARVKEWIHREVSKGRLGNVVSVQLLSSRTGQGLDEIARAIEWYRKDRQAVFVMGVANVGKSTFINRLLHKFHGPKDRFLTVSTVPGTTLGLIRFPLGGGAFLYDTPGLIAPRQVYNYLSPEDIKLVMPAKKIKPVVYRLAPGSSILIAGLARLDYLEGPPLVYFTFFTSEHLYLHKTSTLGADQVRQDHLGSVLVPPTPSKGAPVYPPLVSRTLTLDNSKGTWDRAHADIVLAGLGWISVTQRGVASVRVWFPEEAGVFRRDPLMPFESIKGLDPNPRLGLKPIGAGFKANPF